MQFQTDVPTYKHIADLFSKRQALVFCGAGVSTEPPAGLPAWGKLRDYTLEAVASKDEILKGFLPKLVATPLHPDKTGITPELVASRIAAGCDGYFECFHSLEDGEPNANHKYIAKMAKAGHLQFIITTNFDRFIEKALGNEGVDFQVYRSKSEFAELAKKLQSPAFIREMVTSRKLVGKVHLLKLHGCISIPETITATVEQEGKGLATEKTQVLERLLADYHFVFWGYSGIDLKIDLDYLAMVRMKEKAKGFVWNFLERQDYKETVNPYVAELAKSYGSKGLIVHGKLPDIFDSLIVSNDRIEREKYTPEQEHAWREEKNRRLKSALESWAAKHLSVTDACNIVGLLLKDSGQLETARSCYEHYVEVCQKEKDESSLGVAYSNLAGIYRIWGDYDNALACYEKAEQIARATGDQMCLGIRMNGIGCIYDEKGDHDKALSYYEKAVEIAQGLKNYKSLATCFNNIGMVHKAKEQYDLALAFLKKSHKISKSLGDKKSLTVCYNNLGTSYSAKGNYLRALFCYKKALKISQILGDDRNLAVSLNNIGMIYKVAKKYEKAFGFCRKAQAINQRLGEKEGLAISLNDLGEIHEAIGEYDQALSSYQEALRIVEEIGKKHEAAQYSQNIGCVYQNHFGKFKEAADYFEKSIGYYRHAGVEKKAAEVEKLLQQCKEKLTRV